MTQIKWKYKKVLYFKWKEYHGFIPIKTGIVIEETNYECLIKTGLFSKVWTFKYTEPAASSMTEYQEGGYCKLLN